MKMFGLAVESSKKQNTNAWYNY